MSQRLGPYRSETTLRAVVDSLINMGEIVHVEESFMPYERKGRQYEAYVIRGVSA